MTFARAGRAALGALALTSVARAALADGFLDDEICGLRTRSRWVATSESCVACHDGAIGEVVHASFPALGARIGESHPVEIQYDDVAAKSPGRYRARAEVPRALWLPGGRVTCTTCHDGTSAEPSRVAMPLASSRLCFGCHDV
jgi:predicted CXXCH cytochrome family protein